MGNFNAYHDHSVPGCPGLKNTTANETNRCDDSSQVSNADKHYNDLHLPCPILDDCTLDVFCLRFKLLASHLRWLKRDEKPWWLRRR
jgi:hypothetical protein